MADEAATRRDAAIARVARWPKTEEQFREHLLAGIDFARQLYEMKADGIALPGCRVGACGHQRILATFARLEQEIRDAVVIFDPAEREREARLEVDMELHADPGYSRVIGPLLSDVAMAGKVAWSAVNNTIDGDPRTSGADKAPAALKLAVSNTPVVGAVHSLWYTRAALERAWLNDLNEFLSPGYLARMQSRTQRAGQRHWWEP